MKLPFPLQQGEQVVLVTRRHWVYFVPRFIGYALAAIVPVVALLIGLRAAGQLHGTGLEVALVACAVWVLFWIMRTAILKYRYDHDIWVVTSLRMVDYVATSPFKFRMASADLVQLEDATTTREGLLQSLLDFGNLECQTAGREEHFSFRGVPNPRQIAAVVEREALAARSQRLPPSFPPPDDARTERLH